MITSGRLHDRVLELVATGLDFHLSPAETTELEAHLAACPDCARTAAAMRGDVALLHRATSGLPSRRVDEAVLAAIAGREARSPSHVLVLVAATALLLVGLLGIAAAGALVLRDRLPTVVVNPSPEASPPAWQLATIPPMFAGGTAVPGAIAAGPTDLAVVGLREFQDRQTPAGGVASAWHSVDGLTWNPTGLNADLAVGNTILIDEPAPGFVDVARGPAGYVAVGLAFDGVRLVGGVWRSDDGTVWTRSELPGSASARPAAVTSNGSTYVVMGVVNKEAFPRAAAWVSADGRSWRRVADADAFGIGGYVTYPGSIGSGGPADVTARPDGTLFAVGKTCTGTASEAELTVCSPLVLQSDDGSTWTSVPLPDTESGVILTSVAATQTRVLALADAFGVDQQRAGVLVGDEAGWRLLEPAGVPRLDRVVVLGTGFLALSTAGNEISLWMSADGEAWTQVPGVPQPPDVTALHGVDLAVVGAKAVIAGYAEVSVPAGMSAFSIAGTPRPASEPETPTLSPGPPVLPTPGPGALPATSGVVRMTPGPDAGLYLMVSGSSTGSTLALLAESGAPRSGWPVALDGWTCDGPNRPWVPVVANDGSVRVVCFTEGKAGAEPATRAFAFDRSGRLLAGWPVDLPGNVWAQARLVGDRLVVAAHETSPDEPYAGAQWLVSIARDGSVTTGARYEIAQDAATWPVVVGPDGTAYRLADREITGFDLDGVRPGWPVTMQHAPSAPGFDPAGRVYLMEATAAGASRLVILARDGTVAATSVSLPIDGASAWSGTGPDGGPMAPIVAPDGTVFVVGEADKRAVVYRIDQAGVVMAGFPHRAATLPEWQGACGADTAGCGVWRSTPIVGVDGVLYVPLAAPDAQIGGSLAAIATGGRAITGWPMHLARRGATFWSVAAGSDGTTFALAVEPEAAGTTSATILAVANDGTVLSRTTVIQP